MNTRRLGYGWLVWAAFAAWACAGDVIVEPTNPQPHKRIAASVALPETSAEATVNYEWQHDASIEIEAIGAGNELRIWAAPGEHWLACRVTVIDWVAKTFQTRIDKATFTVGVAPKPDPPDPIPPKPDPPQPAGPKQIIILRESANQPVWLSQLVNDFRDGEGARFLVGTEHELFVFDPHSVDENNAPIELVAWLQQTAPRTLPALYVIDDQTRKLVGSDDLPQTTADVIALIKKLGG